MDKTWSELKRLSQDRSEWQKLVCTYAPQNWVRGVMLIIKLDPLIFKEIWIGLQQGNLNPYTLLLVGQHASENSCIIILPFVSHAD